MLQVVVAGGDGKTASSMLPHEGPCSRGQRRRRGVAWSRLLLKWEAARGLGAGRDGARVGCRHREAAQDGAPTGGPSATAALDPRARDHYERWPRGQDLGADGELVSSVLWEKPVTSVAFSPGGKLVLAIGNDSATGASTRRRASSFAPFQPGWSRHERRFRPSGGASSRPAPTRRHESGACAPENSCTS